MNPHFQPNETEIPTGATDIPDTTSFPVVSTAPVQENIIMPRVWGFLVDILFRLPVAILAAIPFVGIIFAPILVILWLTRDMNGGSYGKKMFGVQVVCLDGSPVDLAVSCKRNISALTFLIMILPVIGEIGLILHLALLIVDFILVLGVDGRRLGDRLANTKCVPLNPS